MTIAGALAWLALLTVPASAHELSGSGQTGKGSIFTRAIAPDPFTDGQPVDQAARNEALAGTPGPCTEATANGMPEGAGHDHQEDAAEHRSLACRLTQVKSLGLGDELEAEFGDRSVVLGEMDAKQDIAAVAVTYPKAGILFFDVSDPANPRYVSTYVGRACDGQPIDIDCGAFVDLSADGKFAFLAVQNLSSVPDPPNLPPGTPGVEVINISNLAKPLLTDAYTGASGLTGVHTARSHVVPAEGGEGPRAPGEYVFANRNSFGVSIARVVRAGPAARLVPVAEIEAPDLHDTFIQEDPIDKRTYLYLADGFGTGFRVFDVTDPEEAVEKGRWDLTPQCSEDWYSHTIDVAVRNGRRYVTLPAELFLFGESSDQEQAQGCNPVVGSGNVAGPMWIVDATDFSQLATAADNDAALRAKSEQALVATWKNPAGRAGGNLTFSPHNQQIVDDKIYLSNYHGGVIVLDASAAFDGVDGTPAQERPREIAFKVPEVPEPRPIFSPVTNPLIPFFTAFPLGRPQVWDLVVYKGYILTQDMTGGFYSLCETDSGPCRTAGSAGSASTAGGGAQGATAAAAKRCSTPRGRLRPRNIGAARLGRTRAAQRKNFVRTARRRKLVDRFCLTDGRHIRVAYASRAAARSGARPRPRLAGKTIVALTASRRYAIRGVKAGSSVAALRRRIGGLSRPYRVGPNRWHLAKGSSSRLVFRVRGGRVREIGVADLGVTSKRRSTRRLLRQVDTS